MEGKNHIELTAFHTCLGEDNIIRTVVKKGAVVTLAAARENTGTISRLPITKPLPLFVNISGLQSITLDARKEFAAGRTGKVSAVAILAKSAIGKVVGNFYLRLNTTTNTQPTKLFTQEDKALKWLRTFLKEG